MALEESILKSVKQILLVPADETAFDFNVITQINTAFTSLHRLGLGPDEDFFIEDDRALWEDFIEGNEYNMAKTYVCLKVRMFFDPPQMGYMIDAINAQLLELETTIKEEVEWRKDPTDPMEVNQ